MTFSIEKLKIRKKRHYEKRKEHILARNKKWVEKNREKVRAYIKKYNEINRDKIKAYRSTPEYKERRRLKDNAHYARTKDRHRELQMAKKYNISVEDYRELFRKQNNLCAICDKPESATNKKGGIIKYLAVDHDHITGKVRGLLCQRCNQAIGLLREDINLIEKIIKYLNAKY